MNESFVFYNLPKFNQDEINNLNRPITPNEIEAVIKSFPIKNKSPRAKWIQHIVPNLQRRVKTSPPQLIHKTNTGSVTLIQETTQRPSKKSYALISLLNVGSEILSKALANRI